MFRQGLFFVKEGILPCQCLYGTWGISFEESLAKLWPGHGTSIGGTLIPFGGGVGKVEGKD